MAYRFHDDVFDEALNLIKNNATKMVLLDADPAGVYADAVALNGAGSGKRLAAVTVAPGDFSLANAEATGGTDGRRLTCAAKAGVAVVADGDGSHVSWLDEGNSKILFTTQLTVNRTGLTTSDTVDFPTIFAAFRDAVVAS